MSKQKLYLKFGFSAQYLLSLDAMYELAVGGATTRKGMGIPFVATAAATLESILNDEGIGFICNKQLLQNCEIYGRWYKAIPLRQKLRDIIPLVTDFRFRLREDSREFRQLSRLIYLRNAWMHSASPYVVLDLDDPGIRSRDNWLDIEVPLHDDPPVDLKIKEYRSIYKAIRTLVAVLRTDGEWSANGLIESME